VNKAISQGKIFWGTSEKCC